MNSECPPHAAGAAGRAVPDCQRAVAHKKLDEHIAADRPLLAVAQVREEVLGLGVRRLVVQKWVLGLALHVGLACEDEHLDGTGGLGLIDGTRQDDHHQNNNTKQCDFAT